jgi:hypothetical protein
VYKYSRQQQLKQNVLQPAPVSSTHNHICTRLPRKHKTEAITRESLTNLIMFTTLHTFKTRNIQVEQFPPQDLYFFFPGEIKSSFATVV